LFDHCADQRACPSHPSPTIIDRSEPVSERVEECCGAVEQPAVLGANLGADFDAFPEKGGRLSDLVPATGMGAWLVGVQIARRISPHRVPKNLETQEVYVSTAVFRIISRISNIMRLSSPEFFL